MIVIYTAALAMLGGRVQPEKCPKPERTIFYDS